MKQEGPLSFWSVKVPKRVKRCMTMYVFILWLLISKENFLVYLLIHIYKTVNTQQFKGVQCFKIVKIGRYMKRVHDFCQK